MSTFSKQINAKVPEAKSKSHDVLAVSNASHTGQQTTPATQHKPRKNTGAFHDWGKRVLLFTQEQTFIWLVLFGQIRALHLPQVCSKQSTW